MSVASAQFEAGQVFLPEQASWLADLEAELFAFPGAKHDDQCDSISQALQGDHRSMMFISPEVLAAASLPGPYTELNRPFTRHSVTRIF